MTTTRKTRAQALARSLPRLAGLAGLGLVVVSSTHCIAPQGRCPATEDAVSSGSTASNSAPEIPDPMKATGPLVFDGLSEKIQGVETPGSWFVMNDKSPNGVMTPATIDDIAKVGVSGGMLHTQGKGFSDWGGGIGFNFANPLGPIDASAYSGLSFTASGSGPMHVGLATVATVPDFEICKKCYDNYSVLITDLSSTPKTYTYKWSELKAEGWGVPRAAIDPKTLVGLNFTSKYKAGSWDFSIKEVRFVP